MLARIVSHTLVVNGSKNCVMLVADVSCFFIRYATCAFMKGCRKSMILSLASSTVNGANPRSAFYKSKEQVARMLSGEKLSEHFHTVETRIKEPKS